MLLGLQCSLLIYGCNWLIGLWEDYFKKLNLIGAAFYILAFGVVGSGIMVISALNPIHSIFLVNCCFYRLCGFFFFDWG